ncbi:MAG: helix-turn-helix transcriptional regulator [Acetobacteraceae bacterium]
MPSSSVHHATDPEELRSVLRPANEDYLLTRTGRFAGTLLKIALRRLWTQKVSESLPRTWHVCTSRAGIFFSTTACQPITWRGAELQESELGLFTTDTSSWQTTHGASELASVSLPQDDLRRLATALAGSDVMFRRDVVSVAVPEATRARLKQLHAAAVHLALTAPEIITNPNASRGLEACLTEALVECLTAGELREETSAQRRHRAIIGRLLELANRHENEPLHLTEVCEAIGVTQRTLNLCCQEKFGVSPKRYLCLRRLHLAHRALRHASPGETSVTDIATRFGFWELGRFSVEYRSVFGETPSITLRAGPDQSARHGRRETLLAGFA